MAVYECREMLSGSNEESFWIILLFGLVIGMFFVSLQMLFRETADDTAGLKAYDLTDDDLKNWFEAGMLREILKEKGYMLYCMGEMFYIVIPQKQYILEQGKNKYGIMIGVETLNTIADHKVDFSRIGPSSIKILIDRHLLFFLNDHNLQEVIKAKTRMNQEGSQFLKENVDYETEQRLLAKRQAEMQMRNSISHQPGENVHTNTET